MDGASDSGESALSWVDMTNTDCTVGGGEVERLVELDGCRDDGDDGGDGGGRIAQRE